MDQNKSVYFALGNEPGGENGFAKSGCRRQHANVLRKHRSRGSLFGCFVAKVSHPAREGSRAAEFHIKPLVGLCYSR